MLITRPMPFEEALAFAQSKQALPTTLSSAELRELWRDLRQRSLFSARVADAGLLHELDELLRQMVSGPTEADHNARAAGQRPLLLSIPEAKARLGDYLDSIDYRPAPGEEGTLKDLRSHARRKLIVETNLLDTLGYGQWAAFQNRDALAQFPAQELVRLRFATRPRDWAARWEAAREEVGYDGATSAASGRMAALKNHPIWQALGDGEGGYTDTLGNPWPPFAFNSGMGVLDIDRDEAVALGLLAPDGEPPMPQETRRLNEALEANVDAWGEALQRQLARLGGYLLENGVLSLANSAEAHGTESGGAFAHEREALAGLLNALESAA